MTMSSRSSMTERALRVIRPSARSSLGLAKLCISANL
uniref:Uncharacterized protein n=1 Tax=Anguilla anguilla TaxID=7936 RepID=A0A0E9VGL0_ANGAN